MQNKKSGERGRLRWKCRRGMLELDLILLPFLDEYYDTLSEQKKIIFERLLEEQDHVLYAWFIQRIESEDKELAAMVEFIGHTLKKSKRN